MRSAGGPSAAHAQTPRRLATVNGKRAKVVDVHAHCAVPEALALMNLKIGGPGLRPDLDMATEVAVRLRAMDEQGIDVEALSINPTGTRRTAIWRGRSSRSRTRSWRRRARRTPSASSPSPSVALQHPELAAEQLETGVKKYGLRGAAIGGSVNSDEISDPKFNPFWAKAEAAGRARLHPPAGRRRAADLQHRLKGNGYLENMIGNPLETTIALSHLIFEGTLDRFPGLKICAAHGGGFLPSYAGRSDMGCFTRPDGCPGGTNGPIKKKPSEYLRADVLRHDGVHARRRCAISSPRSARASSWSARTFRIRGRRPRSITCSARPDLSDEQKVAVLGGTAMKLLGIPA